jgi:hypothetical protein
MAKSNYSYGSEEIQILKALRMSRTAKLKADWSMDVGAGFIAEDIEKISLGSKVIVFNLKFKFKDGHRQTISVRELNLRETIEAIKFMESLKKEPPKCSICGTTITGEPKFLDDLPVHNYCYDNQVRKHGENYV